MNLVTAFSQRDDRWANEPLGASGWTIGKAGCLLTCAASMVADWGVATDPGRLNRWLLANGGFVNGALLSFGALARLGAQLAAYVDCAAEPAPVSQMREALAQGQVVLAATDWYPGGAVQMHWVRVLALDAHAGQIMDPWQLPGQEIISLAAYLAPGWDPARGIFQALFYRRAGSRGDVGALATAAQQPALCLRDAG